MTTAKAAQPISVQQIEAEMLVLTRLEGGPVRYGSGTIAAFLDAVTECGFTVAMGAGDTLDDDDIAAIEAAMAGAGGPATADVRFREGVTVARIVKAVRRCGCGISAQRAR